MTGTLLVVERDSGPVYYGKWRDSTGRQVKRRLGPAWVIRSGSSWVPRRGRVGPDWLDERAAYVALAAAMEAREREVASQPEGDVTFADAVDRWMHHLEFVKGVKPSTLADYRYLLAPVDAAPRHRGRPPAARIMRAFGARPLFEITPAEVGRYLASLDADPTIGPRTVNKHRQVLCTVFEHAMREDTFGLDLLAFLSQDQRLELAEDTS